MTFHKTEQTILKATTYTVEGPDHEGKFNVNSEGFYSRAIHNDDENSAIEKHIESLPKPPTFWVAYNALKEAANNIGHIPSGLPLHSQTGLTEEETMELMRLLGVLNA